MPRNGTGTMFRTNGVFQGTQVWDDQAASGDPRILSGQHDIHDQDIADELTNSLPRDGQAAMTGILDAGGFRIRNVGSPVDTADAIRREDISDLRTREGASGRSTVPFENIPSWATELTMTLRNIQTTGAAIPGVQLGISTSYIGSNYLGSVSQTNATALAHSSEFFLTPNGAYTRIIHGSVILTHIGDDFWSAGGWIGYSNTALVSVLGGSISLGGTLTRIRLQATADIFSNGSVGLLVKG